MRIRINYNNEREITEEYMTKLIKNPFKIISHITVGHFKIHENK